MLRFLSFHLVDSFGIDFKRHSEKNARDCELLDIFLLLQERDSDLQGCGLALLLGIQKDIFDVLSKSACDLESQRQTRIVFAGFNGVDRSASNSDKGCKLGL